MLLRFVSRLLIECLSYSSINANEQAIQFHPQSKESSIVAEKRSEGKVLVDIGRNASDQAQRATNEQE